MAQTTERTTEAIDITTMRELRRLIEEVRASGEPRVLRDGDEDVAILTPLPIDEAAAARRRRANEEAFRSAAGSWRGLVDGERLKRELREARGHGPASSAPDKS